MGMAKKADWRTDITKSLNGIKFTEDIIIFIERCSMTDSNGVMNKERTFSQTGHKTMVPFIQRLPGPFYAGRSNWIKSLDGIQPGHGFVVIASHQGEPAQGLHLLNNLIR